MNGKKIFKVALMWALVTFTVANTREYWYPIFYAGNGLDGLAAKSWFWNAVGDVIWVFSQAWYESTPLHFLVVGITALWIGDVRLNINGKRLAAFMACWLVFVVALASTRYWWEPRIYFANLPEDNVFRLAMASLTWTLTNCVEGVYYMLLIGVALWWSQRKEIK